MSLENALMALSADIGWLIIGESIYENIQWAGEPIDKSIVESKIAEIEANQPVIPDWHGFILSMDALFPVGLQANYLVFTQIFNMLIALRDKRLPANNSSIEWRNFAFNWEMGKSAFSPEQIAEIQAKMAQFNVPVI